jgi:AraC-like DNA-binding protein
MLVRAADSNLVFQSFPPLPFMHWRKNIAFDLWPVLSDVDQNIYAIDLCKTLIAMYRVNQYHVRVKPHFEKLSAGDASFVTLERVAPEFPFYWHYHPEIELTLITDSSGQRLVGDSIADYGPGDLVLLGPNLPHSWRSGPVKSGGRVHRAVVVQFREDFLGAQFFGLKEMTQVAALIKRAACGLAFGHTNCGRDIARRLAEFSTLSPARRLLSLLETLLELAEEPHVQPLSATHLRPVCRVDDQKRIEKLCRYLNQHFQEQTDFTQLAKRVRMDQSSLCRFFKRATGRTITTYINELRIGAATQLLTETDLSVLEIGFRVGFGNYSNFSRQFRRVKGYSPRFLRQQFSLQAAVSVDQTIAERACCEYK